MFDNFLVDTSNNIITIDIIVSIIISIVIVLLGVNEHYLNKQYQKKHLLILYFIITVAIIYKEKYSLIGILSFLTIVTIISAINLAYNDDNLERQMSKKDLFVFKLFEWIFIVRLYMVWLYSLIITFGIYVLQLLEKHIVIYSESDKVIFYLKLFFIIGLVIYIAIHLLHHAKDLFKFKQFDEVQTIFESKRNKFNKKFNINAEEKTSHGLKKDKKIIELMAFVVYMEDKDLFSRDNFVFSPSVVNKRKREYNIQRKTKIEFRGYSTIPQQAIRRIALEDDAFTRKTRLRRKIFIDHIYMVYFFKYYILRRQDKVFSVHGNHKKYTKDMLKVDILKLYYEEVSELPDTKKSLIKLMHKNSKKPNYHQYFYYYERFKDSPLKKLYMMDIAESFYRYEEKNDNRVENKINKKNTQEIKILINDIE